MKIEHLTNETFTTNVAIPHLSNHYNNTVQNPNSQHNYNHNHNNSWSSNLSSSSNNNNSFHYQLPPPPTYGGNPFNSPHQSKSHPNQATLNSAQQSFELSQIVAHQQQLNATAAAAAASASHNSNSIGAYPNLAAYNYSSPAYTPSSAINGSTPGSLNQYSILPPPYLPNQHSLGSINHQSHPNNHSNNSNGYQLNSNFTLPLPVPLVPQLNSLYPALPPSFSYYPTVQEPPELDFNPTDRSVPRSIHSHSSSTTSLSPKLSALSPGSSTSNTSYIDSPSPESSRDRRLSGGSSGHQSLYSNSGSSTSGRGMKRGFEEAAGEFLGELRNKSFRESNR